MKATEKDKKQQHPPDCFGEAKKKSPAEDEKSAQNRWFVAEHGPCRKKRITTEAAKKSSRGINTPGGINFNTIRYAAFRLTSLMTRQQNGTAVVGGWPAPSASLRPARNHKIDKTARFGCPCPVSYQPATAGIPSERDIVAFDNEGGRMNTEADH